jgi:uncharacterized membrane protein YedE/YeeE
MHRLILLFPALIAVPAMTWQAGLRAGFLLLLGLGFGAALSASRFGFTTGWRRLIVHRDPWGMVGQMVLMGLCAVLAFPLLANHSDEIVGAISPITWSLLLGALLFGFSMQLADGCGSGTLYKAGASSPISWVVLPAFIAGSFVGASHQPAWIALGGPLEFAGLQEEAAPVDFIDLYGLQTALVMTLLVCLLVSAVSLWLSAAHAKKKGQPLPTVPKRWLWGAVFIAVLYALHLVVAGQPWGIVYGLGLWGAKIALLFGADLTQDAFWGVAPHATRLVEPVIWDITSVTNIGLLYGALIASRWNTPKVKPTVWPDVSKLLVSVFAGLLMGYSSRMAFGCNVGAYLGGVASASLHGWVWFLFAFIGSIYGVRARQRVGI